MKEELLKELEESILSRADLCRIFKVSKVTIWEWGKKGLLREYHFDRNVYYFKDEVLEDLKKSAVLRRRYAAGSFREEKNEA